ncbi:ThuA domain-containing protein [Armatimonas rosea]|uniref:Glucose dehydrogenase/type 1 glutamine amidotransferase n=1 Tax=Armatimonas rosea TaxID=685828 RepID=A0A7W9SVK3_ARMRO|nr:ThuA domain-containing protein [Armatimonas rosea]MBB6052798.1 glucose dehydrogenase/type 1 glutamine amidotransferase [Armatimonas rosea]
MTKIVFLAGTKSHGPGDHEYEKGMRLFAKALAPFAHTEVHLYGWPDDETTLRDADCIVLYADGSDHNERDHPLLIGNRMAVLEQQMKRGCGLVTLHYATFCPLVHSQKYLAWVGGHFDYESGPGANHWASAIQHFESTPSFIAHPITAGVVPFTVKEEWYYRMRLNPKTVQPLVQVTPPGEKQPETVAWCVSRPDGGRGFACTGGHLHQNWALPGYQRLIAQGILWAAKAQGTPAFVPLDDPLRVQILTGKHHPAHNWQQTTPALQEILGTDTRVQTTVCENPEALELARTDVLVLNYCNWESPSLSPAKRTQLLEFVRRGGGLVLVHFANGAWRDWPEYFGGLARRVWVDGKANHDAYGPFTVTVAQPTHRLTAGLPTSFPTTDELYCSQVGELAVEPLLTARSKVTGKDEPLAYVYSEGKGRIFQTLLGHDAGALRTPAHAELIRRAVAWVGGREVLATPLAPAGRGDIPPSDGGRGGAYEAKGDARWQEPPLTISCRARLFSKSGFNILIASSHKDSPRHWELYTEAGTGKLAVYLPGAAPTNVVADTDLCDGKWHAVRFEYLPGSATLFVDEKRVVEVPLGMAHVTAAVGPLWIGCYPPQGLGCDGQLEDIQIASRGKVLARFTLKGNEGLKRVDGRTNTSDAAPWKLELTGKWPKVEKKTSMDWRESGNDAGRMRHAKLTQVNKKTVKGLKPAWEFRTGDAAAGTTIECTPIVVEGVMYLTTVKLRIVALEAATGKPIWVYDPKSSGVHRGLTYWSDGKVARILAALPTGQLLSLDARTGMPDPAFGKNGIVQLRDGYTRDLSKLNYGCTSALALFENTVIVPIINSEGQPGAPGDIRAFDVRTGKEVWRFHTVPEPGEFGNDTWAKDSWRERSGTNAWSGYTVDTKNAIVFASTGSAASDFYGADRHGQNLFANCLIALDARTGKRLWHFQTVHHDLWDHDNPCPPTLCTVKGKECVALPTKTGFVYVFERKTGKSLFPIVEKPVPPSDIPGEIAWPTQPMPLAPPPLTPQVITDADLTVPTNGRRYGTWRLPPSLEGTICTPGFHGGANWSGASFDPATGYLFVNTNNVPSVVQLKANGNGGYDFMGYNWLRDKDGRPGVKPPWGSLTAVDLTKGTFAWRIPLGHYPDLADKTTGTENFGGSIVTEGGLVFIASTRDEHLRAFDKDTGKLLWEHKLPAGGYACPATYSVNGKQFIVIAAGGGGKLGTKSGDSYVAFAL